MTSSKGGEGFPPSSVGCLVRVRGIHIWLACCVYSNISICTFLWLHNAELMKSHGHVTASKHVVAASMRVSSSSSSSSSNAGFLPLPATQAEACGYRAQVCKGEQRFCLAKISTQYHAGCNCSHLQPQNWPGDLGLAFTDHSRCSVKLQV